MSKITVAQAVKLGYSSQATIYRDMRIGELSYERNGKNRRLIDISELSRVYGEPQTPPPESDTHRESENSQTTPQTHIDKDKIITILEKQVQDLQDQVASERIEKAKLLELADRLQKQNEVLMLPKPKKTFSNVLSYFGINMPTHQNRD